MHLKSGLSFLNFLKLVITLCSWYNLQNCLMRNNVYLKKFMHACHMNRMLLERREKEGRKKNETKISYRWHRIANIHYLNIITVSLVLLLHSFFRCLVRREALLVNQTSVTTCGPARSDQSAR